MPELPEVETIRRQLEPWIVGRTVSDAGSHPSAKFTPAVEIIGATFETARRRGKYLLFGLDDDRELIVHLGMTGQLLPCACLEDPYLRAWWQTKEREVGVRLVDSLLRGSRFGDALPRDRQMSLLADRDRRSLAALHIAHTLAIAHPGDEEILSLYIEQLERNGMAERARRLKERLREDEPAEDGRFGLFRRGLRRFVGSGEPADTDPTALPSPAPVQD